MEQTDEIELQGEPPGVLLEGPLQCSKTFYFFCVGEFRLIRSDCSSIRQEIADDRRNVGLAIQSVRDEIKGEIQAECSELQTEIGSLRTVLVEKRGEERLRQEYRAKAAWVVTTLIALLAVGVAVYQALGSS